ncbi:hypothetical protein TWF696_001541 [Orbilia brochopaga]|uniref:AT hook domain-containing protein n=1 Tax=Orbilia brochopaga TaxID=3140254 RepID=A0AAV9U960_9PEZI
MAQEERPRRSTRSLARKVPPSTSTSTSTTTSTPPTLNGIATLPPTSSLTTKLTGLSKRDIALLQQKQRLLQTQQIQSLTAVQRAALSATLVFAQAEAGTAFCISPGGLLLTCSHCVAESDDGPIRLEHVATKYLLFADGRVVAAKCIAYDSIRDLSLLQIVACQPPPYSHSDATNEHENREGNGGTPFPYMAISPTAPKVHSRIFCIGHPGSEDLESPTPRRTNYGVLHVSGGRYRGVVDGADVQDNGEIGALMHDCWTYWGHSGAPLCLTGGGGVVGVHSSWDEGTGMRRGVAWEAVVAFLGEYGVDVEGTAGRPIPID